MGGCPGIRLVNLSPISAVAIAELTENIPFSVLTYGRIFTKVGIPNNSEMS
jgi:hypothetical protein